MLRVPLAAFALKLPCIKEDGLICAQHGVFNLVSHPCNRNTVLMHMCSCFTAKAAAAVC
jgi:hypothetical protein